VVLVKKDSSVALGVASDDQRHLGTAVVASLGIARTLVLTTDKASGILAHTSPGYSLHCTGTLSTSCYSGSGSLCIARTGCSWRGRSPAGCTMHPAKAPCAIAVAFHADPVATAVSNWQRGSCTHTTVDAWRGQRHMLFWQWSEG
jgi:hypothetical protein